MLKLVIGSVGYFPFFLLKRFRRRHYPFNLIIFDMDGTITECETFKSALMKIYNDTGENYKNVIFTTKHLKDLTKDNIRMQEGLKYLITGGFNEKMEGPIIKDAVLKANKRLTSILPKIGNSIETLLITRSSETGSKKIAKLLGVHDGYGSLMVYNKNGTLIGAKYLVTDKVPKIATKPKFTTKLLLASNHMKKKGKFFCLDKTAFVGNDILDVGLMAKCGLSILVKKKKMNFIEALVYYLHLYDFKLETDDDYSKLANILTAKQ